MQKVHFLPSWKTDKKRMAIFRNIPGYRILIVHFGQGISFTEHKDIGRRDVFINKFTSLPSGELSSLTITNLNPYDEETLNRFIFNCNSTIISRNEYFYRHLFKFEQ
eukprot:Lithocolla_globosa_v1_NODE_204_length_5187_cov_37.604053.p6 type:complete len:107 gc:universal NODE_204_length_5187_cov_37.604053:2252-1932(-)